MNGIRYIQLDLTVSTSDGDQDGGETFRMEGYTGIPALLPGEAAHRLPDLVAALAGSLVAAMQEDLRAMEASE